MLIQQWEVPLAHANPAVGSQHAHVNVVTVGLNTQEEPDTEVRRGHTQRHVQCQLESRK